MKTAKLFIPVIFTLLLMSSCNSGSKNSGNSGTSQEDLNEIIAAADAISPEINSVQDVFSTLDLADASYFPVLCNDPYNASNYLESKPVAAANLGVYVTDIVYHMYGDATESMFLTFSATQELARYMGLESEFAATLLTQLEGGQISRDSLITVFSDLMAESEAYNSAEEMVHVHTAFLTGLYIEKLYITSSLLEQGVKKESPTEEDIVNQKKLLVVFINQLKTLDVLKASLENHKKKLNEEFDLADFEKLSLATSALEKESESILNKSGLEASEELTAVYNLITTIRTRIVSAS